MFPDRKTFFMSTLLDVTQCVIFGSYFVISCIVAYVFLRHRSCIDTLVNRLLLVTAGLFLMLCALTHLYSVWASEPPEALLIACALVSFVAAVCTTYTFRGLDDYLRLRVTTMDVMREEIVTNLTKGYDLKVRVSGNAIIGGIIGTYEVVEPHFVSEEFVVNSIIRVGDKYFRIANIVESFVEIADNSIRTDQRKQKSASRIDKRESFVERGGTSSPETVRVSQVYGYDATAEVRMRNESDRMNRMKMDLCMTTAHHVRTPLSCIGIALTSLRSLSTRDEHVRMLEEAFVHFEIINMVVTQFVDVAAMDSKLSLKPCVDYVDIRALVSRVEKVLKRIKMDGVYCTCLVGDCVPNLILTDSEWIVQILLNLVANATKYTARGKISVTVTLENQLLCLVVKDTGVGMSDSKKIDIFEPDLANDVSCGNVTVGIGLLSVKTKVNALDGEYWIVDNPGGGTILSVRVPVKLDHKCYTREKQRRKNVVEITRVRSILVVDDTPSVRKLMQRYLRGHRVHVAIDGAEGLEKMKDKKFDLVLMDMMMPVLDGAGCLRKFRKWEKYNRPVGDRQLVYCVSATSVELDIGFDGSIPKPVDTERLHRLIQTLS